MERQPTAVAAARPYFCRSAGAAAPRRIGTLVLTGRRLP